MAKLDKLITYAYLKEECDLPQNIDDIDLEHKIYRAQEMLRMILGDAFYQAFLSEYKSTLSAAYQALYSPYVKQFVAWQSHQFYVVKANFKSTRSGYRVHTEENSVVATDAQMAPIHKDANQQAQYYKELLIGFLDSHASDYPLYTTRCGTKNVSGNGFHISAVKNKNCDKHRRSCKTC